MDEDMDRNVEMIDLKIGHQIPTCTMAFSNSSNTVKEFSESVSPENKDVPEELQKNLAGSNSNADDDTPLISPSNEQGELAHNKRMKKRDKKKHKKKKRAEINIETEVEDRMEGQTETELQAVPLINTGNHCHSEPIASSVSCGETIMCRAQPNDDICRKGKPSPSQSLFYSQQGHFIDLASSASNFVPSYANLSNNINVMDAQCGKNNIDNIPQRTQHTTASLITEEKITHVQTTVDVLDQASENQSDVDIVSTEAQIQKQESSFCNIPACVGESCVERAIQDALVEAAALPLTTPTMREVIKSERESVSCDSWEGVATKAIAGIGKGEAERHQEGYEHRTSLLNRSIQISSVECSNSFPNEQRRAVSEESYDSKMPHSSAESCSKGQRETSSAEAAISPAEEGDREKERLWFEGNLNNFSHGIFACADHLNDSAAGLEGGGVTECSSFSLPEGAAGGVSVAEKKTCPPTDVAESYVKSLSSGETLITITDSLCPKEELAAAFSPLPPHIEQSNTESGDSTQHHLNSEEPPFSGTTCEASAITETSLFSTSNNQQVQPESTPKATDGEVKIQAPAQNPTSSVGKSTCDKIGGSHRVHFADSVKEDCSVEVRNMSVPTSGCSSLPPLTVHESLYHPVVEASYIYPDFLSLKKPETSSDASYTKDEAAFQSATPMSGNDILLETHNISKKIESDPSGEEGKRTTEKNLGSTEHSDCLENAVIPTGAAEPAKSTNELIELTKKELNKATKEPSEQRDQQLEREKSMDPMLTKEKEVVTEKGVAILCVTAKEINTLDIKESIKPDNPEELKNDAFLVEERESSSSCTNATLKPKGDLFTESPDRQLSSDLDAISNLETAMLTCSVSPQTKHTDLSAQPPAGFDQPLSHALVGAEPIEFRKDSKSVTPVDLIKDGSVGSEAIATERSISVHEQCASNSTSIQQTQGLLLSDVGVVDEVDVTLSEGVGNDNAECDSIKTHMTLVDDQEHEEAKGGAEMSLKQEDRNDTECINSLPCDPKLTPLQGEEQPPECELANDGSDNIMTQATPDLINDICPLSSNKPNGMCDNTQLCDVKGKQNMDEKTSVSLEDKTEQLNNQKETEDGDKLHIENGTPQRNEVLNKDTKVETGDLAWSHEYDIQSTESNMVNNLETELKSELHFDQDLHKTLAETMEHQDNRDTSTDLNSNSELNDLSQQQEQLEQDLVSKYSTEGLPGACAEAFEEGGMTNSHVKPIQAPFSGGTEIVGGDGESFETAERQIELSREGSSITEQVVGVAKVEKKESQIIPGVDNIVPLVCDLTDSRNSIGQQILDQTKMADMDEFEHELNNDECTSTFADEGSGSNLIHDNEFLNSMDSKGETENNQSDGELHGNHLAFTSIAVPSQPLLEDHDISRTGLCFSDSASKKEAIRSHENDKDVSPSETKYTTIQRKMLSTVEKDHSGAQAVETKMSETERYKIPDTICEPLESQCSNKSLAIQNGSVTRTPIKGPHVEEAVEGNNAALDEENADLPAKGPREFNVVDEKATEKNGPQDKDPSSADVSNHACHYDSSFRLLKAMENVNETTSNPQPSVAADTPSVSSKSQDDDDTVLSQTEKLPDHISPPIQPSDDVVHPPACNSDFEHVSADTAASHVSDSSAGLTTQEPDTNWITALREAASCAQPEQESTEIPRPLPSLESPQQEFLTPTEEGAVPLGPEQTPQEQTDITPLHPQLDLAEQLERFNEQTQETTEIVKKEEERIKEYPISISTAISAHQTEPSKPAKATGELGKLNENKTEEESSDQSQTITEHLEPEKKPKSEFSKEKPESTETLSDPAWVLQKSGHPHTEHTQSSPRHLPPAPLTELPTPPPAPPSPEKTPPASPHGFPLPPAPDDPRTSSAACHLLLRSSDSDGAFETPESTTPVKAPADPQNQFATTDDKGDDICVSAHSSDLILEPLAVVFDEDRPIAASGTYNFEHFASESTSQPLTRSLSLQGGELDTSALDGSVTQGFRPHSESFSVGTESNPGTLRRPRKVRPGSVKKKPLLRQNSNPERPSSTSSTPETIKRTVTQEGKESGSPAEGGSPAGTLRKSRKTRVDTPPPLPEENTLTESAVPALPLCQEENHLASHPVKENLPIPPSGSYKWDPDNFESIDPFKTGGSNIANSPVLARKGPECAPVVTPPDSPPIPTVSQLPPPVTNPEEQPILPKRESVRLEFDYSEETSEASHGATPPPKKLGKKPGAKMPLRKPKSGLKKAHPGQTEQLDNNLAAEQNGNKKEKPISRGSYDFDCNKWDDPNYNPFLTKTAVANSPTASYSFDFDDSGVDPFKSSIKMANSPPKASASFDLSSNEDMENDNDNIGELEDPNQNKPAKKKKTPIKSNTFRVKRSPKKSQLSDNSQDADDSASLPPQDGHATDEEKLASSTNHKWAGLHDADAELNSDQQDFPHPSDLTSFVNESGVKSSVQDYEIEYMEKIGSTSPPPSVKKPSLYLKLDSLTKDTRGSEPNSPCTGSFEEMEAQITASMKTPVLSSRPGPEGSPGEKGRKRESEVLSRTQSTERDEQPGSQDVPSSALTMSLLERLSECGDPVQYLEPDLAETNPNAFAQKLQSRLKKPSTRRWNINGSPLLKHRDVSLPSESSVSKSSLYARTATGYIDGESPHLPKDMDHSLGIAKEEIVMKEREVLEWQRKYEDSRQEVQEMRRIVSEYEKTIAQMIGMPEDDQKEKSLSHHTIQQLIIEKDQALADLNSVEKSLADLFRRYEKMKDVLEGFRKNEDVLKKCAQEYLSRVRKEEQRYQALKIHAEEKLDKANLEIAQVRAKSKQEQAAHQASLRKEQMKVESLERTLEQKNKEIEELTKICDELIAKMGKC
ncbi:uncharacterized protein tacc2 isoform X3 [Festucalex cinctus]